MSHTGDIDHSALINHQLRRLTTELTERFHGIFDEGTVRHYVADTYAMLRDHATVDTFLVSLTARLAHDRLTDLGRTTGLTHIHAPQVLFVCEHNVGRSPMAGALLEHHAQGRVVVRTAGSHPRNSIPATVTQALDEIGAPLTHPFPIPITDEVLRAADVVVLMGPARGELALTGRRFTEWHVDDPVGQPIDEVRRIRDELDVHVLALLDELWQHDREHH